MKRAALLSVSDRTGLNEIARALSDAGYILLATSGTRAALVEAGIPCESVELYTGQPEILGGRVKTLHPKIHGGLLAKREDAEHMAQLQRQEILPIDVAIVNLYPFIEGMRGDAAQNPAKMIELIDIGGPTMIRAAAKNFRAVLPLIDPSDYPRVIELLDTKGGADSDPLAKIPLALRRELAGKVFSWIANYNLEIAKYLSAVDVADDGNLQWHREALPALHGNVLVRGQELRYGENPHQRAAFYRPLGSTKRGWKQLQGKELSYNNLLDFDAAFRLIRGFRSATPTAAILKHLNPCGAASADELLSALESAKRGDPRSHFGGVIAFNVPVNAAAAAEIAEDFAEIVVAPGYDAAALELLGKKKNLRVLQVELEQPLELELRSVQGGVLLQEIDDKVSQVQEGEVVTTHKPNARQLADLQFAWAICAHVKSNAIALCRDRMLLASGAGQTSRIDSVEVALHKARTHGHDLTGAVAASDAFFPFSDCIEVLAEQGIRAVVAPRGAKRDDEVIAVAERCGVALIFVTDRHFRH